MKVHYEWKGFPEPLTQSKEVLTPINAFTSNLGVNASEQATLQCTPDGSVVDTFLQSDVVTTYIDLCTNLATLISF